MKGGILVLFSLLNFHCKLINYYYLLSNYFNTFLIILINSLVSIILQTERGLFIIIKENKNEI